MANRGKESTTKHSMQFRPRRDVGVFRMQSVASVLRSTRHISISHRASPFRPEATIERGTYAAPLIKLHMIGLLSGWFGGLDRKGFDDKMAGSQLLSCHRNRVQTMLSSTGVGMTTSEWGWDGDVFIGHAEVSDKWQFAHHWERDWGKGQDGKLVNTFGFPI